MSKTNNKSIVFNLGIMVILAFSLIFTPLNNVSAAKGDCIGDTGGAAGGSITYEKRTPTSNFQPTINVPTIISNTDAKSTPVAPSTFINDNNNLGANVIFGSTNHFLPSGLLEWVTLAILILIAVILVRKFYGPEDKYHAAPLKHS